MSNPTHVGYAVESRGRLVFGDPAIRHLILGADELTYVDKGPDDHRSNSWNGPIAWVDVRSLETDASTTWIRRPGAASTVLASALALIGWEWHPGTADFGIFAHTDTGEVMMLCDGFVGRGYWTPHARALDALADILVAQPSTRASLNDPAAVLRAVATVATHAGLDDAGRRSHLAARLSDH